MDDLRRQIIVAAHTQPECWWEGYRASRSGKLATECPYGPVENKKMMSWLSGHVTATDEKDAT